MKQILVLGAGRSSGVLINHLSEEASEHGWQLTVADAELATANEKVAGLESARAVRLNAGNESEVKQLIGAADLVISMLPAHMHAPIARQCVALGRSLFTASYVSDEMQALDAEVRDKGLLFLNECGLDPGIDHVSAMQVIDRIRNEGHQLTSFETFAGGLLAPHPDNNPWEYKFTWNPRNVVLAAQGGVKFIQEGCVKYIPYHRVFNRIEVIHIPGHGYFEGYANRDSLKYIDVYGLRGIRTLYRGTLRRLGFCEAWDVLVQIGATDDSYEMEAVDGMTHRQFINSFLSFDADDSIELKLAHYVNLPLASPPMYRLRWSGLFDNEPVGLKVGTPAQILEHILKKTWALGPDDRDMIVMWHKFGFLDQGRPRQIQSHMVCTGDADNTAMARTVGLPLAIAASLYLRDKMKVTGVLRPVVPEIYEPLLESLRQRGVDFVEREVEVRDKDEARSQGRYSR